MDDSTCRALLAETYKLALHSNDASTQNAAKLIRDDSPWVMDVWGVNNFPPNVLVKPERLIKPIKYKYVEHAERAVIYRAARMGLRTEGLTMVCCWAPCCDCARAIIESGIKTLITHRDGANGDWEDDIKRADEMLHESDIELIVISGKIFENNEVELRRGGKLWCP